MNLRGKKRDITKTMHSCIYYMYSATVEYVILMLDIFLAMMAIARSQNRCMVLPITNKTKAHQKFQKSWKFCRKCLSFQKYIQISLGLISTSLIEYSDDYHLVQFTVKLLTVFSLERIISEIKPHHSIAQIFKNLKSY